MPLRDKCIKIVPTVIANARNKKENKMRKRETKEDGKNKNV